MFVDEDEEVGASLFYYLDFGGMCRHDKNIMDPNAKIYFKGRRRLTFAFTKNSLLQGKVFLILITPYIYPSATQIHPITMFKPISRLV